MTIKKISLMALSASLLGGTFIVGGALAQEYEEESFWDEMTYTFTTGFDFNEGSYDEDEDTEILSIPYTLRATSGPWSASVTVPYVSIRGPGSVSAEGEANLNGSSDITTESGFGDASASLRYTFDIDAISTYLDVTGRVKFPTAKDELGTGEYDYTILADATKMFRKSYLYIGGGYRFVGDSPDFDRSNTWQFTAGGGYQITPKFSLGLGYDFREASGSGEDPSEITAFSTYRLNDKLLLQVYGSVGFSEGSADSGIGVQLGYKFDSFLK